MDVFIDVSIILSRVHRAFRFLITLGRRASNLVVHVEAALALRVLVLLHLHLSDHHIVHHLLVWRVTARLAGVARVTEMSLSCVEHLLRHAVLMVLALVTCAHLWLVLTVGRVRKVACARVDLAKHLAILGRLLLVRILHAH